MLALGRATSLSSQKKETSFHFYSKDIYFIYAFKSSVFVMSDQQSISSLRARLLDRGGGLCLEGGHITVGRNTKREHHIIMNASFCSRTITTALLQILTTGP
jgi:hypothetical protein